MIEVLVVGAGPAGLTTALLLARYGVRVRCVDKHGGISPLPRARGVHARAVEILRACGLEEVMREAELTIAPQIEVRAGLTEPPIHTLITGGPELAKISPSEGIAIAQDVFESVLREALIRSPGAELCPSTEFVGSESDEHGVSVELLDRGTGHRTRLRVQYVIGADGWASPVRAGLGITVDGEPDLGVSRAVTFRADLTDWLGEPPPALVSLATFGGVLLSTHVDHRWVVNVPDQDGLPSDPCALVRHALGLPTLELEVLTNSSWTASAQVARQFAEGRVFLVGDAAHRVPPAGGTGISSAMADAHNVAWKLAAALRGWAGPNLLQSYDAERRPVAVATTAACLDMWRTWTTTGQPGDFDLRWFDMGYAYGEPAAGLAVRSEPFAPDARVGSRAPHVRLDPSSGARVGAACSTLDLFGDGFTLLSGPAGGVWRTAATLVGSAGTLLAGCCGPRGSEQLTRIPLAVRLLDEPAFAAAYELGGQGVVLVRPDGHIAWRWSGGTATLAVAGASAMLAEALLRATGWRSERTSDPSPPSCCETAISTGAGLRPH